jgi:ActR/RegA family two-component response regulator
MATTLIPTTLKRNIAIVVLADDDTELQRRLKRMKEMKKSGLKTEQSDTSETLSVASNDSPSSVTTPWWMKNMSDCTGRELLSDDIDPLEELHMTYQQ